MVWPVSYDEQLWRYRQALRRGRRGIHRMSSSILWGERGQLLLDKAAEGGRILNGLVAAIRPAA